MFFPRRWFLILSVLVLGGGQLLAASREDRVFAAATAAFHDGFYDRAETEFADFRQRFKKSDRLAEAVLFQAQAQFKLGKYSEAEQLLAANRATAGAAADRFDYWTGEMQFARGDFMAATGTFAALVKNFPQSALGLSATVGQAAADEKQGYWPAIPALLEETNGRFRLTEQLDPTNSLVTAGRLLLARAKLALNDPAGANAVLAKINPAVLPPDQEHQRLLLFYTNNCTLGDLDAAFAVTTNLIQLARRQKDPAWLADGVAKHALVLEGKKLPDQALAAWKENLAAGVPADRQQEAVLKMAALAAAQGNWAGAAGNLESYLTNFPDAAAAGIARLTLGELYLKDFSVSNHLALAQAEFDRLLLGAATNDPLAGRAFMDRGWCFWQAEKYPESGADFHSAALRLPLSEELAVARFKTGEAQFKTGEAQLAQGQLPGAWASFSNAWASYQSVRDDFSTLPAVAKSLGAPALYQLLRTDLQLKDAARADAAMRTLLEDFPQSELADQSMLLTGEAFSNFSLLAPSLKTPESPRKILQEFAIQFPGSPLQPQVGLAVARTFERETNWPAAITNYENWLQAFPTNALRWQAEYARAWATSQAGEETNASALFAAFVAQFPTNELAPLAQWWVADYFFRRDNFNRAETNYEAVYQNPAWQNSPLVYPAQLMAARAAMGRLGFLDARNYLTQLLTNCPPALKTQAMFAYGSVLMRLKPADTNQPLANFGEATNVFASIYHDNSTNELGGLAANALGDAAVQLGDFAAATNAYALAANSPFAGPGPRGRARVALGLALEKQAALLPPEARPPLLQQALENYLDVLYPQDQDDTADAFWTKKAGLQALPLMITLKVGDADKLITRLEGWFPQLKDSLEKKRAALDVEKN
jgi:TolA-binding protein